jgi:hypothetical protein
MALYGCLSIHACTMQKARYRPQVGHRWVQIKNTLPSTIFTVYMFACLVVETLPSQGVSSGPIMVALHTKRLSSLCGLALTPCIVFAPKRVRCLNTQPCTTEVKPNLPEFSEEHTTRTPEHALTTNAHPHHTKSTHSNTHTLNITARSQVRTSGGS